MASPQQKQALDEKAIELTDNERIVLTALENAGRPIDTIALATATSLSVEETLEVVGSLKAKGVVEVQPPEPIRERFQVDENALQRVG